jgi:hypothetical protein
MINLLTTTYIDRRDRMRELLYCLRQNIENKEICTIQLFIEDPEDKFKPDEYHRSLLGHPKVLLVKAYHRVTYAEYLGYGNRLLNRASGTPVILANADIYFDQTIEKLTCGYLQGKFICLSRYWTHLVGGRPTGEVNFASDAICSQDAWAWGDQVPIPPGLNFTLGQPGCDNRIAAEMKNVGLEVLNPSKTIKAYHLHDSNLRHYNESMTVPPPHLHLPAVELT